MKDIEYHLRQLGFIEPSKAFQENARRRLMAKISHEPFWIVRVLKNIFKPAPGFSFKEEAWMRIVQYTKQPRISVWDKLGMTLQKLFVPQFIAVVVIIAFTSVFVFSIPQTDATAKTELMVTNGVVEIKSLGGEWRTIQGKEDLKIGDQIRTNVNGKAEIQFPNYSVIRIASDTRINLPQFIEEKKESPVIIQLQEGKIWSSIISQKQDFFVETKHSRVSTDFGIFDVEANETTHVRAIQNAVQVEPRETTNTKSITISAGFGTEITDTSSQVSLIALNDAWSKENQKKDESLREEILEKEQEETANIAGMLPDHPFYEMKELVQQTFKSDEFEKIQGQFAASKVLLGIGKEDLARDQLTAAKESLRVFWSKSEDQPQNQQLILSLLEKEKVFFMKILPGDSLFPFKKDFQELFIAYANNPEQEVLNQVSEKMMEVQNLVVQDGSSKNDRLMASLSEFKSQNDSIVADALESGEKKKLEKILAMQNQNLKLLQELSPNIETPEAQKETNQAKQDLVNTIQKIVNKIAPEQKTQPRTNSNHANWFASQIKILADKVNTYKTQKAQLNTVYWIVKEIDNKESNLSFLYALKNAVPEEVRFPISKKILEIRQQSRN